MSENTIENCYDIILENEDYTMGKVIEYILYEKREEIASYCGFKKNILMFFLCNIFYNILKEILSKNVFL